MQKQLIIFGVAVLLICVGLSGCNESEGDKILEEDKIIEVNLGDSITIGSIKYTFLDTY